MGTETTPRLLGAPTTGADVVIVREGKNFKGRVLSDVLGTVGKRTLKTAFFNSVNAIEARSDAQVRKLSYWACRRC
jgi:hypothetical protein